MPPPPSVRWRRRSGLLAALVAAGVAGSGTALVLQPVEGWTGLLTAGLYGVTLALGGALFLAIQVVSGARFWFPLRGVPLRLAATLPVPLAAVGLVLVLVAPSQGPVPSLPLGALAATVAVLAGMRLLWERDRPPAG